MDSKNMQQIVNAIEEAEFILIGASNGLEMAEGYNLFAPNDYFMKHYGDFREKYDVQSILQGLMQQPFPDEETLWAFFARGLYESYHYEPTQMMENLRQLIDKKPHFILTSNGTRRITASGFRDEDLFEIEGSMGALQCSQGCHDEVYPVGDWIDNIYEYAKDSTRIPSDIIPRCKKCGAYMMPNAEISHSFIRSEHWHKQQSKAQELFQNLTDKSFLVLELGIGIRNQLIKGPLMNLVYRSPQSTYVTINKGELYIPYEIHEQSIGVDDDVAECFLHWSHFLDSMIHFHIESELHGREHSQRVLLYSLLLADSFDLEPADKKRLAIAAVFHDSKRWDDGFDVGHGQRATEYYKEYCEIQSLNVDTIITAIIAYHDQPDEKGEAQFNSDETLLLFHIFKDADGLDRFRLCKDALDPKFLRTKESFKYIDLSRNLNQ